VESSSQFLRPSSHFVSEHVQTGSNENQRPKLPKTDEVQNVKIVEQEQSAETDKDDRPDGTVLAPGLKRISRNFTEISGLCRAHGLKRAVEDEAGKKNAEHWLEPGAEIGGQGDNDGSKNCDMNEALVVLTVVDSAETGEKAEDKGDGRTAAARRARDRQRSSGRRRVRRRC